MSTLVSHELRERINERRREVEHKRTKPPVNTPTAGYKPDLDETTAMALFLKGCKLCVEEATRYSDVGIDLARSTNGNTSSQSFREEIFTTYNELVSGGYLIEAYCLFRIAFANFSAQQLMTLSEENRLITERDAYQCAQHDDEIPF